MWIVFCCVLQFCNQSLQSKVRDFDTYISPNSSKTELSLLLLSRLFLFLCPPRNCSLNETKLRRFTWAMTEWPWAMQRLSVQAFGEMIFWMHAWFRWILCKHIHTHTGKCAGSLSVGRWCVRMNTSCLPAQLMTSEQECLMQHLLLLPISAYIQLRMLSEATQAAH